MCRSPFARASKALQFRYITSNCGTSKIIGHRTWREVTMEFKIIIIITNRICVTKSTNIHRIKAMTSYTAAAREKKTKIILSSARVQWGGEDRFSAQSFFIMPSSSPSSYSSDFFMPLLCLSRFLNDDGGDLRLRRAKRKKFRWMLENLSPWIAHIEFHI